MSELDGLSEQQVSCPYCGEPLNILVDPGDAGYEYTEDCQVCCRPIRVRYLSEDGNLLSLEATQDT